VTHESIQTSPERSIHRIDIGTQTTPSLDPSSRRHYQTIEQQTTPIGTRSSRSLSCQTTPVPIAIQHTHTQQTSPIVCPIELNELQSLPQQQATPIHSKAIIHLRRNVHFQFTPSTDARLAAKEKQEEDEHRLKQEFRVHHIDDHQEIKPILSDDEREEDTEDEIRKQPKTKKKGTTSKKKKMPIIVKTDESSEDIVRMIVLSNMFNVFDWPM
jgi:hypothetical protein